MSTSSTALTVAAYLRVIREDLPAIADKITASDELTLTEITMLHEILDGLTDDAQDVRAALYRKDKEKRT